jgi:hypothetical protein
MMSVSLSWYYPSHDLKNLFYPPFYFDSHSSGDGSVVVVLKPVAPDHFFFIWRGGGGDKVVPIVRIEKIFRWKRNSWNFWFPFDLFVFFYYILLLIQPRACVRMIPRISSTFLLVIQNLHMTQWIRNFGLNVKNIF